MVGYLWSGFSSHDALSFPILKSFNQFNDKEVAANLQIDWNSTTGLLFASDTEIVGLGTNAQPNAQAGQDQSIVDIDGNGLESLTLNGASSSDDVAVVDYIWSENSNELIRGANPQVNLPVGTHTLTLTVIDDDGETDTDEVVIIINAPNATLTPTNVPAASDTPTSVNPPTITPTPTLLPNAPVASINDVRTVEGTGSTTNLVFTVSLSAQTSNEVTVNYTVAPITTIAGKD